MDNKVMSCVETSVAPEWLSKLESRREKLTRPKLGHEAGAGAPCNECGNKCPGLDLHFWRKVCRNCKCRKDQHMCADDNLSGWAQFEILGQIRSKPAYIKIKAFADKPIKVEWVPPNVTSDLASDYMDKLGSTHIPVEGSDAAAKRKQQLEFQVPPHDLDAALCDNLTETEAVQMKLYVDKIKNHCVGQGSVIRVGNVMRELFAKDGNKSYQEMDPNANKHSLNDVLKKLNCISPQIVKDKVLMNILKSEGLAKVLLASTTERVSSKLVAFSQPLVADFMDASNLSKENKNRLTNMGLNKAMVQSLVENGALYDSILKNLREKNVNFSQDPILASISNFRVEYLNNKDFKDDMIKFVEQLHPMQSQLSSFITPDKSRHSNSDAYVSPLLLRNPIQTRTGSLMKQDTPIRRLQFGDVNTTLDLGLPIAASIKRDPVLFSIVNSEALQSVLQNYGKVPYKNRVTILDSPLTPDFEGAPGLSHSTRKKLEAMGLNKDTVLSGVVNGPLYDKLFSNFKESGLNYAQCHLLKPIEDLRQAIANNIPFQKEVAQFVEDLSSTEGYKSFQVNPESLFGKIKAAQPGHLPISSDSEYNSKPPTPNYMTFPSMVPEDNQHSDLTLLGFNAHSGKFAEIPGIKDFNMYPQVEPTSVKIGKSAVHFDDNFDQLHITTPLKNRHNLVAVLKCKECLKDIMTGEVAVKAERAGEDVGWHPQCFVCHNCRELLADLVYFFHNGNVYCGRDLAIILKIPRCNACDELIFTKEYTAAEGATFHIKHFCCYHCDTPLAGQQYVPDEKTNMPLCLKCYDEYYAERCQYCANGIGPAEQGVAWGKIHWHGNCFICAGLDCGKSLLGGRFCVKNDMPFCSPGCVASVIK